MIKFSLLMCVYAKENPAFFSECLDSVLAQTVMPDEFLIVKDGPLTDELEAIISNFPGELNIVALPENVTLGPARAEGVKAAKHEWIAIMDTDDICFPDRFEKQTGLIKSNPELGLLGGQIAEFNDDPKRTIATRAVPVSHKGIYKFAKKRNPFNSMTVMFRRELALQAGNYRYFPWFEDYDLWARMMKNGVVCANHPDILINARVGNGMYNRRRGKTYIKSEWRMQKTLRQNGLINRVEFIRNLITRVPIRMLPEKILAAVYNRFARGN